jgi:hypothetical protein
LVNAAYRLEVVYAAEDSGPVELDKLTVFSLMLGCMTDTWTMLELQQALREFESDLRRAGKSDSTVHTYVDRADRFLRYLRGDYQPGV